MDVSDMQWLPLLAQDPAAGADGGGAGGLGMLPAFLIIGVAFYLMFLRPQRQEQAKHQTLLSNLKKDDRVVTVGGIKGVVTNVRRDHDEVTVRIDDTNNTRMRITLNAIARVDVAPTENEAENK